MDCVVELRFQKHRMAPKGSVGKRVHPLPQIAGSMPVRSTKVLYDERCRDCAIVRLDQ